MPDSPSPAPDPAPRHLLARLWRGYIRARFWGLAVASVLMAAEGSMMGGISLMLKPLFDKVFAPGGGDWLPLVGGGILALFLARAVISVASRTLLARSSQRILTALQIDLLAHALTLDQKFYQANPPGTLIERIQGDPNALQGIWTTLIAGLGRDLVGLITLFAVALSIDAYWTAAALIGAPLLMLPTFVVQRYIRAKAKAMRKDSGLRVTRLDEIFHGIQAVKLNRIEAYQIDRFRRIVGRIMRAEVRSVAGRSMMPALIDVVTGLGFFAVLILAGGQIARGERTTGEFMAFFSAMALTFQPIRRLGDMAGLWQIAQVSLVRVFELLDTRPATFRPAVSHALPPAGAPDVTLHDVHFAHGDTAVLHGVSFTAPAGKVTALVGASGAGKSTIFHLLTALAEPDSGTIRIGGVDTAQMSLTDLRRLFASVTQDPALFDESLRDNLILDQQGIAPERLQMALDAAHVSEFLAGLAQGLDTPVGLRGQALSGGQRQRVAIARALLRDAPILLLDEATSALDAQSELLVADALAKGSVGRTTLVIAHRLATIRGADKIVVLDRGRVVEEGTHASLLAAGGLYARLYGLQFGPEDIEAGS